MLQTKRLILRPWQEADAEDLYLYAKDPDVGPITGWQPHTSIENSREIIRDVLSTKENYAVCLKEDNKPIGSVGFMIGDASSFHLPDTEAEIGYWIGKPFWGQGLIPEAVNELLRYGFEDLKLDKIWCGYFDGNTKSQRVQEKCGFKYHHREESHYCAQINEFREGHVMCMTKEDYNNLIKEMSV